MNTIMANEKKAPAFVPKPFDLAALPPRTTGPKIDAELAGQWLATVTANGAASDEQTYASQDKARNAGMRAARLIDHVNTDKSQRAKVQTFIVADSDGKYGFVVSLTEVKATEAASA